MDVLKLIKLAFVVSVLLYGLVAVFVAGAPEWSRPVVPQQPNQAPLFWILLGLAVMDWIGGFILGSRSEPPGPFKQVSSQRPWPITRFVVAAALIEAGALFGLVLAILCKDSRPALFTAAVSAILLLMTPTSDSPADQA